MPCTCLDDCGYEHTIVAKQRNNEIHECPDGVVEGQHGRGLASRPASRPCMGCQDGETKQDSIGKEEFRGCESATESQRNLGDRRPR